MTPSSSPHHARRWWILALLGIAQLMVVLDTTIVNIALPSAQKALHFSNDNRQWIVTAYALAFGSLLLLGGRLSDLLGRKTTFVTGLLGFSIVSAIGGAAGSFEVLVAARTLQGVFGAILAPAALSLLTTTFTAADERGKAFGIYGAIAGGGAAIGLLLGGVLTEYLSWRWSLYVNLAFAIPTAVAAMALLHNERASARPKLDLPGTLTASLGLFALVYGFSNAETHGWGAGLTIGMFVAAVVMLVSFVLVERRSEHPLLPLRVVLDRSRGGSYLAMGIAGIGMFGVFLFLTYYLQQTLGFSPIKTGLAFLPMTGVVIVSATAATAALLPRFGPRPLVALGMALSSAGMMLLTGIGVDTSYASHVLPSLLLLGVGLGLIFAPGMSTATLGVEAADAGVASALVNTMQQVGGSLGTALLSTLAASATSTYLATRQPNPAVLAAGAVHGYTVAFWVSAGIFALGAVLAAALLPRGVVEVDPNAEPVLAH
jgi:EmrB/QacA subfamily drug resistance transporter